MSTFSETGNADFSSGNYAYGSSGATGHFDIKKFFSKPQVICRILSLLFAVIVAGCIASQGWESGSCNFNGSSSTCNFGVFLGVASFFLLGGLIVLDVMFDNMSNILHRKYAVIADILTSGVLTFLWFACFCNLADQWRKSSEPSRGKSAAEASVAFSFFSILSFGVLTGMAVKRYREGVSHSVDQSPYTPDPFSNPDNFSP